MEEIIFWRRYTSAEKHRFLAENRAKCAEKFSAKITGVFGTINGYSSKNPSLLSIAIDWSSSDAGWLLDRAVPHRFGHNGILYDEWVSQLLIYTVTYKFYMRVLSETDEWSSQEDFFANLSAFYYSIPADEWMKWAIFS